MEKTKIEPKRLLQFWMDMEGIDQAILSRRMGVTQQRIYQLMKQNDIKLGLICSFASVFNVLPSTFIYPAENDYKI